MSTAQRLLTPEELERKAHEDRYELDGGKLVKREMSVRSSFFGGIIHHLLVDYAEKSGNGIPFSDNTEYQCFPDDPSRLRKPDVSWFSKLRAPKGIGDDPLTAAPDLIVEVISPNEKAAKKEKKVQQFFAAGASEAWIVYPDINILHRQFADGRNGRRYGVDEELDGAPLLPGFSFKLADVLAKIP